MSTTIVKQLDFSILAPGAKDWGVVFEKGLTFAPSTTREQWIEVTGVILSNFERTSKDHAQATFYVADAFRFGEDAFGEDYAQVIDAARAAMRIEMKTLQNAAWVASKVPAENRHIGTLKFAHHEAVAALDIQAQAVLLDRAENEGMSVPEFKAEVRRLHPSKKRANKPVILTEVAITEEDATKAFELLLTYFQPLTVKGAKISAEQKKAFGVQMAEFAKIAAKFTKK